jgi:cysteinyl-tRNA synthetase
MSKSLKNFVTIRQVLRKFSGRQVRIMVLMHKWDTTFDYVEKAMPEAVERERQLDEFFLTVKAMLRDNTYNKPQKWTGQDVAFSNKLLERQQSIHNSLCDNFDTPAALLQLLDLVSATNVYMKDSENLKLPLLLKAANFVQSILTAFGVIEDGQLGFPTAGAQISEEEAITPLMTVLSKFRDSVKTSAKEMVAVCDKLRDEMLPELGIRLEDKGKDQPAVWKKVDAAKLKAEAKQKEDEKRSQEEEKRRKTAEDLKRKQTPASQFFKTMTSQYSQFDAEGLPTHAANGKELSKEIRAKLKKDYAKQDKIHKQWLADEAKKPSPA